MSVALGDGPVVWPRSRQWSRPNGHTFWRRSGAPAGKNRWAIPTPAPGGSLRHGLQCNRWSHLSCHSWPYSSSPRDPASSCPAVPEDTFWRAPVHARHSEDCTGREPRSR
uniref:AT03788p n=1 Tax=Drosophila melanogaster TaxID=7227 RepID=Q8T4C7_DROME|nr:AT03788p [Drosophila melanogaster]